MFQSVSGLWDRRNARRGRSPLSSTSFNPSPVCGTGEISRTATGSSRPRFQSVSGLWDRRNVAGLDHHQHLPGFNPSPVCGTGEMLERGRLHRGPLVSIRLRSVGPEKLECTAVVVYVPTFQSVSGLWDRRNLDARATCQGPMAFQSVSGLWDRRNGILVCRRLPLTVSIRLRSVGPEKSRSPRRPTTFSSFNPSPVCGTGEICLPV